MDLFETVPDQSIELQPLAERMRPKVLKDFFGQRKTLGKTSALIKQAETQIFYPISFFGDHPAPVKPLWPSY